MAQHRGRYSSNNPRTGNQKKLQAMHTRLIKISLNRNNQHYQTSISGKYRELLAASLIPTPNRHHPQWTRSSSLLSHGQHLMFPDRVIVDDDYEHFMFTFMISFRTWLLCCRCVGESPPLGNCVCWRRMRRSTFI